MAGLFVENLPHFPRFDTIFILKLIQKNMANIKILALGDIVGKIGRRGVITALPELKKRYKPDLVIANAENLSHGKGVSEKTLNQMIEAGIDFFTSGNHIWDNKNADKIFNENKLPIIRPANYPTGVIGDGYKIIEVGTAKVLIANLNGRVFFRENFDCPFRVMEKILADNKRKKIDAIIVDLHAEATSEKKSFAHFFDGKINLIMGTHTHTQTADEQILPGGSAFISDLGMCGAKHSSLGIGYESVIRNFLEQTPALHEIPEHGTCQINGIFAIIKQEKGIAKSLERFQTEVEI